VAYTAAIIAHVEFQMELLTALETRSSAARLAPPGPTPQQMTRLLDLAARAPDHGRLKPWRLIVVDEGLREAFALAAAEAKRLRLPTWSAAQVEAEREKYRRSPAIVVVGCAVRRDQTKVPEIEQFAAAAAAAQNLFLAAYDMGYGVMWKTGAAAYDPGVKACLGLKVDDHIVAIMHMGARINA